MTRQTLQKVDDKQSGTQLKWEEHNYHYNIQIQTEIIIVTKDLLVLN